MDEMIGEGARVPLEAWFWDMPICTRWWTTATILTSGLVQCQIVTPFQLFYSFRAVFHKYQVSDPVFTTLSIARLTVCSIGVC
jgi:Derlin-2/3